MDKELKKKALTQLLKQEYSDKIKNLVDKELKSISSNLLESNSHEELIESLSLLNILAFREIEKSLEVINKFVERIQVTKSDLKEDWNRDNLIIKSLEILNYIRYGDEKKSLKLLLKYSLSDNKRINDKVKENLKNISEYNINILKEIGPTVQKSIIEELEKLTPNDKVKYSSAICIICSEMLSCETSATSSSLDSMTFHRGSIDSSQDFREIRENSIAILQEIYDLISNSSLDDKVEKNLEVITAMDRSCWQNSQHKELNDQYYDLYNLVLDNEKEVAKFYTSKIEDKEYKILIKMDSSLASLHHKSHGINNSNTKNEKVVIKSRELEKIIENFRDKLDQDKEFIIYRDLGSGWGYKSIFTSYYGHSQEDAKNEINLIPETIKNYAKTVNDDNLNEWIDRIFNVIRGSNKNNQPIRALELLKEVVKINPDFGPRILSDKKEEISTLYEQNFHNEVILNILSGLVEMNNDKVENLIIQHVEDKKYLKECALSLGSNKDQIDIGLLRKILSNVCDEDRDMKFNNDILLSVFGSIENHLRLSSKEIAKDIRDFSLQIIKKLTINKNGQLSNNIIYGNLVSRLAGILSSKKDCKIILDNLLLANIDYGSEEVLSKVIKKYPKEAIDFFEKRIEIGKSNKGYEAIPYEFYNKDLRNDLIDNVDLLFAMARGQFDKDKNLFECRAAKIFQAVFKDFEEPFEKELIKLVKTKNSADFDFAIRILDSYTSLNNYGEVKRLHNVCKQIINSSLYSEDGFYTRLYIILSNSGVVWGKYGRADQSKKKVEDLLEWKNDSSDKVREFYDRFSREELENAHKEIARVDKEEELRKYEFEN